MADGGRAHLLWMLWLDVGIRSEMTGAGIQWDAVSEARATGHPAYRVLERPYHAMRFLRLIASEFNKKPDELIGDSNDPCPLLLEDLEDY